MSTQSPHPPTPKGSRNNRRPQKKNMTPQAQKPGLLSTPPSSPPRNMSPAGNQTDSNITSKKKPMRSAKKPRDNKASPAPTNGYQNNNAYYQNNGYQNNAQRQTPSHSVASPQMKDSAAYAGPTFHASPAPSALPMPSFFSKSAPDSDLVPPIETDSDTAEMEPEPELTPSKPRSRPQTTGNEPKPTPLDFLFQAAVQARNTKSTSSPEVNKVRSPQTESKAMRSNPDGMFAFEMENSVSPRNSHIGPSFAPSYQDRMNALQSARPSSTPQSPDITEEQRRMKTEELKHLLLNPRPQKPPSAQPNPDQAAFGAHPSNIPPYATPMRTSSGPPMTMSHGSFSGQQQPIPNNAGRAPYPYPPHSHSPLRREVAPSHSPRGVSNGSSPAPYRGPYMPSPPPQRLNYTSPQPHYPAGFRMPTSSPSAAQSMDTKQIEDDIRRVLKLGATSGMPSSGIQSSFA